MEVATRWENWVQREKDARGTRFHYWFCCAVVVVVVVVQSVSRVQLFVTPWTAARQASLSSTVSCSLLQSLLCLCITKGYTA